MSTENGGILSCYQIYGYVFEICFSHLTTNIGWRQSQHKCKNSAFYLP